ncbi:hypothetical protein Q8A73_006529 [Channa argus]|nr:hypothetical protein Q8A73_006529 [Channa argus]
MALVTGQDVYLENSECGSVPTVPVIVGDSRTSASITVANTLGVFDIPMVSYLASCGCLSDKRRYPLFFRTMASDAAEAKAMAELLRLMGWTWVGLVSADDDFGRFGIQMLMEALRGTDVCVAYYEIIPKDYAKTTMQRIVKNIQKSTARVVVAFLIDLDAKNVTDKQWIASDAWATYSGISVPRNLPSLAGTIGFALRRADIPGLGPFLTRLNPNLSTTDPFLTELWETLFGCSLSAGLGRKFLSFLCNESLVETGKSVYADVSQLRITYNVYKAVYAIAHAIKEMLSCEPGKGPFSEGQCPDVQKLQPVQIAHYLRHVNFTTPLKEWINFDQNGDPPASYDIINWHVTAQGAGQFVTVGHFMSSQMSDGQFHIDMERVVWGGGSRHRVPVSVCSSPCPPGTRKAVQKGRPVCCFDCLPCADGEISNTTGSSECIRCPERFWSNSNHTVCIPQQVDFLSFSDTMGIILSIVSAVGTALTAATFATFLHYRHTPLGVYGGDSCQLMVKFIPDSVYRAGDVVIGGLFPVHVKAPQPELEYQSEKVNASCEIFNQRAYRWLQAMIFAVEEINNNTDFLPNFTLGYLAADTCLAESSTLSAAMALVTGQDVYLENSECGSVPTVPVIVGDSRTSASITVANTLGVFDIPMVSYLASCGCLSDKRRYPLFFRTMASDAAEAKAMAELLRLMGWTWVGLVSADDDFGRFGIQMLMEALRGTDVCVAYYEIIPKDYPKITMQRIVESIQKSTAKVVVTFLIDPDAKNVTDKQWVANDAWATYSSVSVPRNLPSLAGTIGFALRRADIPGLGPFLTRLNPNLSTTDPFLTELWETLFGCSLSAGLGRKFLSFLCNESLVETGKSVYADVSQLRITYNVYKAVYAIAHAIKEMLSCEPGKGPFSEGQCPDVQKLQPVQIAHYLRHVNFTTPLKEWINFDQNGDPPASYDIINWHVTAQGAGQFVTVGHFMSSQMSDGQFHIDMERVVWGGGSRHRVPVSVCSSPCPSGTRKAVQKGRPVCCFDCLPCADGEISNTTASSECIRCPERFWSNSNHTVCIPQQVDFLSFSDTMGIILSIVSAVGTALTAATFATFLHYRHTPLKLFLLSVLGGLQRTVRHICLLLLGCLSGIAQGVYGGDSCQLMVKFIPDSVYRAGDVVIGGLFPVHVKAPQPELEYQSEKVNASCEIFNQRAYRWLQAMIFAVEQINNNTDFLPNFTLGYLAADTCLAESSTLSAAMALVTGQDVYLENSECGSVPTVPVIVGDSRTSASITVANTLGVFDIPMVSYFASCGCLSDKRRYPLFFRTMASDAAEAKAMAELLCLMGWTWVGLVSADDDFGRFGIQMLMEALRGTDVCVAYYETIPKDYPKITMRRIVESIQKSTAKVVVTFLIVPDAKKVTDKQWIANDAWATYSGISVPSNLPSLAGTIGFALRRADIPGLGPFLTRLNPNLSSSDPFLKELWETLFGCSLSAGLGRKLCSGSEDIETGKSVYADVSQLRITYNVYKAVYAIAYAIKEMLSCEPGKGPFLEGQCPDVQKLQPVQIAHYLRHVNFTTPLKEWINFDQNGDPPASYDIINWHVTAQGAGQFVTVGHFMSSQMSDGQFQIDMERVVWGGGSRHRVPVSVCSSPCPPGTRKAVQKGRPVCCFDCLPCADGEISNTTGSSECIRCPERFWSSSNHTVCIPQQVDFLSFSDTMGIILSIVSAVGTALTAATFATFLHYRHTPLVK